VVLLVLVTLATLWLIMAGIASNKMHVILDLVTNGRPVERLVPAYMSVAATPVTMVMGNHVPKLTIVLLDLAILMPFVKRLDQGHTHVHARQVMKELVKLVNPSILV
jgi:hypothetical protein